MEENTEVQPGQEGQTAESNSEATLEQVVTLQVTDPIKPNYERSAAKYGHKNLDDWVKSGRDPDEWVPAEDFIKNYTWVKEIRKQESKVEDLTKALNGLVEHNKKLEEVTYRKVYDDLSRQLEEAAAIGDAARVKSVNQEIVKLEVDKNKETSTAQVQTSVVPDFVNDFIARNHNWFNNKTAINTAMRDYAVNREMEILNLTPGIDRTLAIQMVEDDVKKTFSHQFTPKVTSMPKAQTSVESGSPVTKQPPKEFASKDLPDVDRKILESVKKTTKNFDEKDYIRQWKIINGIK